MVHRKQWYSIVFNKHPDKVGGTVLNYIMMHQQEADDDAKAVELLMRQHKPSVIHVGKRCREITGAEYVRVMKTQKVVKLRMNPQPKKDGRKKWRLLVKDYMEPAEWTGTSDSPIAMGSTITMLTAMRFDPMNSICQRG